MDSKKIGNRIYELRNNHNLTQKELADKLLVTSQAVSKWENGRGIPDIEMLQRLSEIFNIDISELLTGNIKKKDNNKKSKKILVGFIIVLIILLVVIGFGIINVLSKEDFQFSKLESDNDSFYIKGIMAYSNNKKSIYISEVDYFDEEEKKEFLTLECVLYEINGSIEKRISECVSQESNIQKEASTLSELLKDVELSVDNYSCSCNALVCNKLYLKINAINQDNEIITYNIPIELEQSCDKIN